MTGSNVRRRPKDEDAEVFFDVVEAMLDVGFHENQASRFDRPVFVRDPDQCATADHVVDLVLLVGTLVVGRSRRPDRQAYAELVGSEKVDIPMTVFVARLRVKLGNL